jgi:hypothetical protein
MRGVTLDSSIDVRKLVFFQYCNHPRYWRLLDFSFIAALRCSEAESYGG